MAFKISAELDLRYYTAFKSIVPKHLRDVFIFYCLKSISKIPDYWFTSEKFLTPPLLDVARPYEFSFDFDQLMILESVKFRAKSLEISPFLLILLAVKSHFLTDFMPVFPYFSADFRSKAGQIFIKIEQDLRIEFKDYVLPAKKIIFDDSIKIKCLCRYCERLYDYMSETSSKCILGGFCSKGCMSNAANENRWIKRNGENHIPFNSLIRNGNHGNIFVL